MKMIIMRGLPASGKSTRAQKIVEGCGNYVRINRDLLRTMLHFGKFNQANEMITIVSAQLIAKGLLAGGRNVVIDDTNLSDNVVNKWKALAAQCDATVEIIDMMKETGYNTCLDRDATREKKVGAHVITDMAIRYNYILGLRRIVVVDIDGTVSDPTHRLQYASGPEKDWDTFFALMDRDTPRHYVYNKALELAKREGAVIVFVTARPEKYREVTHKWLMKNYFSEFLHIIMRRDGDSRPDTEVKSDIYEDYLKQYEIVGVFDDRPSVIRMWREKGLNVIDVGNGIDF